ncbi:unnamed protein product, partial [Strongylus vulgaris]
MSEKRDIMVNEWISWHTATLILLGLALLTSFLSICLGMCSCCYGSLTLVFTALTLLTTLLSAVAEGIFFFYSHRADNRFIKGIVGTYETLARFSQFCFSATGWTRLLLANGCRLLPFPLIPRGNGLNLLLFLSCQRCPGSLQPSAQLTNECHKYRKVSYKNLLSPESMEFDAPLMYQSQTPQPSIRQPYSKQEEYDRHVAESMPELGMT